MIVQVCEPNRPRIGDVMVSEANIRMASDSL
jgi:hypothetical protein